LAPLGQAADEACCLVNPREDSITVPLADLGASAKVVFSTEATSLQSLVTYSGLPYPIQLQIFEGTSCSPAPNLDKVFDPTNEGSGTCDMKPYVIKPDGNIQAAALNCPNKGCAIGDLYGQHGYFDNSLYSGAAVTVKACNTILFSSTGVSGILDQNLILIIRNEKNDVVACQKLPSVLAPQPPSGTRTSPPTPQSTMSAAPRPTATLYNHLSTLCIALALATMQVLGRAL